MNKKCSGCGKEYNAALKRCPHCGGGFTTATNPAVQQKKGSAESPTGAIIALCILSGLALMAGWGILVAAKSAIHEIEAFILFLISAVLIAGAANVGAINRLIKEIKKNKDY